MAIFSELAALAKHGAVVFGVAGNSDGSITVTISGVGDSALSQDFQITQSPAQIDAWFASGELSAALNSFRVDYQSLAEVVEASKAVMAEKKSSVVQSASKQLAGKKPNQSALDEESGIGVGVGGDDEVGDDDEPTATATAAVIEADSGDLFD